MRLKTVWQLARKEIISTFRDRRALISNIAIPLVLMPLFMLGMPLLLGNLFEQEAVNLTPVAVEGLEYLPADLRELLEASLLELQETADAEAAVRDRDVQASLKVPEGFAADLAADRTPQLVHYTLLGNMQSELAGGKLDAAISVYRDRLVEDRVLAAGLTKDTLQPLQLVTRDASSEQQRSSGMLGWMIPFFIAMWALMGGQMTAIDATAGEKERGTMEALLVTPVSRLEVVFGKWLATLLFGLLATLAAVSGYLLGGAAARRFAQGDPEAGASFASVMGGSLKITPQVAGELLLSSVLLTGFIAALLLFISIFARSFKEAQSYVGPLSLVLVVPAVGMQFRDFFDIGLALYAVPIMNALLAMFDTVQGTARIDALLLTWGSTLTYTVVLLFFAWQNFRREGVIFRT